MNLELSISIVAAIVGVAGLALAIFMFKKVRSQRELLEFLGKQVEDQETALAKNKETLETTAQRLGDQARRIAWLETRVRQPKAAAPAEEAAEETFAAEPQKLTMTERRHRVTMLSMRGQSVETIAATLGMLPGEVELIISLSQPIKK